MILLFHPQKVNIHTILTINTVDLSNLNEILNLSLFFTLIKTSKLLQKLNLFKISFFILHFHNIKINKIYYACIVFLYI